MSAKETVILLHGIGHAAINMAYCEHALKAAGYNTVNLTYPSLRKDIPALTHWLNENLNRHGVWEKSNTVHFVTHSLGGLISGFYLQNFKGSIPENKMGRVVMLGTPHGGSEVADALKDFAPYRWIFGPAGQQLTTAARKADQIQPWFEVGIIAGTWGKLHPVGRFVMQGEHDGCVTIESTKVAGMKDHIIMPVSHSFIGWKPAAHKQIIHFLQNGTFKHGEEK